MIIDGEEYVAIKEFPKIVGGTESLMKLIEAPQKGVIGTSTIAVIIDELGSPIQFSIAIP